MDAAAKKVVDHLLFANEFQLTSPVGGTSEFANEFAARGLQTPSGKSLRQFNLKTRLFEYPCSYVIDTPMFAQLPAELKQRVIAKLLQTLRAPEPAKEYPSLNDSLCKEILAILKDNHPEFFQTDAISDVTSALPEQSERLAAEG